MTDNNQEPTKREKEFLEELIALQKRLKINITFGTTSQEVKGMTLVSGTMIIKEHDDADMG